MREVWGLAFDTPLGTCTAWARDKGLVCFLLPGDSSPKELLLKDSSPSPLTAEILQRTQALAQSHLKGTPVPWKTVPLDWEPHSPFLQSVWRATLEIPWGETISYGDLARRLGNPNAARAVGMGLGKNPLPLVVPCHRVCSSTGALHGYSGPGGLGTKQKLLEIERGIPTLF